MSNHFLSIMKKINRRVWKWAKSLIKNTLAYFLSIILPPRIMKNKELFGWWEGKGYHVTPCHYYEPIPDTRTLKDDLWNKQTEMVGININEKNQIQLLSDFVFNFKNELT